MSLLDHSRQLAIIKTNKGRYAVRPITWALILDEYDRISEDMNHVAIFGEEKDAREYIKLLDRPKMRYSEIILQETISNLAKFCPIKIYYNDEIIYNDECKLSESLEKLEYKNALVYDIMIEIVQYHHSVIYIKGEESRLCTQIHQ